MTLDATVRFERTLDQLSEHHGQLVFLHAVKDGAASRSYGIQVARLAGVPATVINRAKKILTNIENGSHRVAPAESRSTEGVQFRKGARQLALFSRRDDALIEKLKRLDIGRMTPLEALNLLNELRELAKHISN